MGIGDLYFSWWLRPGKTHTITSGGLRRTFVVHLPKGHDLKKPLPVVLALHGATMNGPMMAWFCDLNRKADQAGFIVVYPNGTGKGSSYFWNGGNCCGSAAQKQVDDVGFIRALLDDLERAYPVDGRRIYATGMSNGAIMAYRLAAELGDRIAAVAPVAGAVGTEVALPTRPVSVLHFHGTLDEFIPFSGGIGSKSITGTDFPSVHQSVQTWVKANGCSDTPMSNVLTQAHDPMPVTRKTYAGGKNGTEVVLVEIQGGGHTWPGLRSPTKFLGPSTRSISANDLMWEFFQKHSLA